MFGGQLRKYAKRMKPPNVSEHANMHAHIFSRIPGPYLIFDAVEYLPVMLNIHPTLSKSSS